MLKDVSLASIHIIGYVWKLASFAILKKNRKNLCFYVLKNMSLRN